MLGQAEIMQRLKNGEIFLPDTWSQENVRATGYDLRMAYDFMIVPDPPEAPTGRRYEVGEKRTKPVILRPGDVAFVSTLERFAMPWDLCANIGYKFSIAARGIMLLTGLIVDPGFGYEFSDDNWMPKKDERLHFFLANLGMDEAVLEPGREKIASIQFFTVSEPVNKTFNKSIGAGGIRERFFDHQTQVDAGLEFFRNVSDLRSQVIELMDENKKQSDEHCKEIERFRDQIDVFDKRVSAVESGSNQVVMFGVYLMSTTILGVALAVILQTIPNLKTENTPLLIVGLVIFALLTFYFLWRLPRPPKRKRKRK